MYIFICGKWLQLVVPSFVVSTEITGFIKAHVRLVQREPNFWRKGERDYTLFPFFIPRGV